MKRLAIIPARLGSTRFKNKLLKPIKSTSIFELDLIHAKSMPSIDKLIVVTDSTELANIATQYNVETVYTNETRWCGSQKLIDAYEKFPNYDCYISIAADEPLISPKELNGAIKKYDLSENCIYTLYSDFYDVDHLKSLHSCKIAANDNSNEVLYFSRALIPSNKYNTVDISKYKKHIGIFFFTKDLLFKYRYKIWSESFNAKEESLEQNAFIENGFKVKLIKIIHEYHGIDIPEHLEKFNVKEVEFDEH